MNAISCEAMKKNLEDIHARVARAATRSGRRAEDVTLIGVSKFQPIEALRCAVACGVKILGENRVQECEEKRAAWNGEPVRWHMIGHLQRNKARKAVALFDCIQSVDSEALAETLERICGEKSPGDGEPAPRYPIMVEVNTSGEASKNGIEPDACNALIEYILTTCPRLSLEGLMTIGPLGGDERAVRTSFARLRSLAEEARARYGIALPHLSMGMSGDYEAAIEEGSTMVRIGTGIFGSRPVIL